MEFLFKTLIFLKINKHALLCLLKRVKKEYYQNLDMHIFKDNKTFWKNIRPLFSDKLNGCQKEITLIENDAVISDEKAVAEKLNNYLLM